MTGSEFFFYFQSCKQTATTNKIAPKENKSKNNKFPSHELGDVAESNSQYRLGNYEIKNIKSYRKGISLLLYFLV